MKRMKRLGGYTGIEGGQTAKISRPLLESLAKGNSSDTAVEPVAIVPPVRPKKGTLDIFYSIERKREGLESKQLNAISKKIGRREEHEAGGIGGAAEASDGASGGRVSGMVNLKVFKDEFKYGPYSTYPLERKPAIVEMLETIKDINPEKTDIVLHVDVIDVIHDHENLEDFLNLVKKYNIKVSPIEGGYTTEYWQAMVRSGSIKITDEQFAEYLATPGSIDGPELSNGDYPEITGVEDFSCAFLCLCQENPELVGLICSLFVY